MDLDISSSEIVNLGEKNPHHLGDGSDWYVEVSFMAHVIAYFILGVWLAITIYLIMKCAGACDPRDRWSAESAEGGSSNRWPAESAAESEPVVRRKEGAAGASTYGAMEEEEEEEEDPELGRRCRTSEDLYEGKTCVICYDAERSCFFTPCGHSVACAPCALRITEEENKLCPVCRRLIHKVRNIRSAA